MIVALSKNFYYLFRTYENGTIIKNIGWRKDFLRTKEKATVEKLNGRYFTPKKIADFITDYVLDQNKEKLDLLEPSVGGGIFLESIKASNLEKEVDVLSIEIDEEVTAKTSQNSDYFLYSSWDRYKTDCNSERNKIIVNDDFYTAYKNGLNEQTFDGILGNPPYIRYQYLNELQKNEQSLILEQNGITPNKLINAWVAFVVASISCMKENSKIGLVLPFDLLQVKYAKELRSFLTKELNKCLILTFNKLVFEDIEQDVVILLGEKVSNSFSHQMKIIQLENEEGLEGCDLDNIEFSEIDIVSDKWTKYFLSKEQVELVDKIREDKKFISFSEIAKAEIGITTGNNGYFCLTKETVDEYDLKEYCKPLLVKSSGLKGLWFTKEDWEYNVDNNAKAYLLDLSSFDENEFPEGLKKYIKYGEERGFNSTYKTRIRNRWYDVPSIWSPDIFYSRRIHYIPKTAGKIDTLEVVNTDTLNRITLKKQSDFKKLMIASYSSVALLFTELEGRNYGGGVLEVLPSELSKVMLPNIFDNDLLTNKEVDHLFNKIDNFVRTNEDKKIDLLIEEIDNFILIDKLQTPKQIIFEINKSWKTLQNKRIQKNK